MILNYFKIAVRYIRKHKMYSLINLLGLTLGMTCFVLIATYIQYEFSYDRQHEDAQQIYRAAMKQKGNVFRGRDEFGVAPIPLIPAMKENFPEVIAGTTLGLDQLLFSTSDQVSFENGLFADEYLFDVFTYPIIAGDGRASLKDPNSVLLTRQLAVKLFGSLDIIGETIKVSEEKSLIVHGILDDIPENQHFKFNFICSIKNLDYYQEDFERNRWNSNNYRAYFRLADGYNIDALEDKMSIFDETLKNAYQNFPFECKFFFQRVLDIHLYSDINFEAGINGDIQYVYLFLGIGIIILLLGSINYTNLATARTNERIKEIGMRKVLGGKKKQIIIQLLSESFLLSIVSLGVALVFAYLLLPLYNQLLDKSIPVAFIFNARLLSILFIVALVVGFLSGLYPAIFITASSPIQAFKGDIFNKYKKGGLIRSILVVSQFVIAIALIVGSLIIAQQMRYIKTKELGYNRNNIVYIPYGGSMSNTGNILKNELRKLPGIIDLSLVRVMPLNSFNQGILSNWEGNIDKQEIGIYRNYTDHKFLDVFEIDMVEGSYFTPEMAADTAARYVINEAAVRALGWETAVGKKFRDGTVLGVVSDYHFQPFNLKIEPQFISHINNTFGTFANIALRVEPENIAKTLNGIKTTLKRVVPNVPLSPRFMDEQYNLLYEGENRLGNVLNIFTLLAIFIAVMGLFGLVSYQVMTRSKEIGIRKILGASVDNIVALISQDFVKLILVAILIAIPLSLYFMNNWLNNFAYRINIQWWIFLLSGCLALGLAFATIAIQTIRAASRNPIQSIRVD